MILVGCVDAPSKENKVKVKHDTDQQTNVKVLRHVVLFKFKESSSPGTINALEKAFVALPSKIKEIKDLEWGLNNSPEGRNKGFTHCFFSTFENEAGLAAYLPHPDHQAFVKELGPHLDDLLVLDYWTK